MRLFAIMPFLLQTFVWIPTRVVLYGFARIRVYGRGHLKDMKAPVLFATSHTSEMDPIIIPGILTPFSRFFPLFYVARSKEFYKHQTAIKSFLYGGLFFKSLGAYPAYRGHKNYEQSLTHHIEILERGKSMQIFPQGGKAFKDGHMLEKPAHGGVAFLSWRTNTPIIPTAIKGVNNTTMKDIFLFRKRYSICFGTPIYPEDLFPNDGEPTVDEIREAAQHVLNHIRRLYEAM